MLELVQPMESSSGNQFDEIAVLGIIATLLLGMLGLMLGLIRAWVTDGQRRNKEEHEEIHELLEKWRCKCVEAPN